MAGCHAQAARIAIAAKPKPKRPSLACLKRPSARDAGRSSTREIKRKLPALRATIIAEARVEEEDKEVAALVMPQPRAMPKGVVAAQNERAPQVCHGGKFAK